MTTRKTMTSFGWKRKAGGKICKSAAQSFTAESKDEEAEAADGDVDWLTLAPKRKFVSLEDPVSKSERLKSEGVVLAEAERFWEAMKKWDEAIQFTPNNEAIIEMKTQALMAVGEVYPAVQAAEKTVELAPTWWVAYQTLGRAQASIGEVRLALKSFSRAVHLNPAEKELWIEDLLWTKSLLERRKLAIDNSDQPKSTVTIKEIKSDSSSDSDSEDVGDKTVIQYSAIRTDNHHAQSKNFRQLPQNYVQMRDPT